MEMTTITSKEWTTKNQMLPTPSQRDYKGGSGTIKEKDGKFYRQSNTTGTKFGVRLDALMEYKARNGMLPTPTAMDHLPQRGYESMKKQAEVHRKGRTKLANLREAVNPEAVELFNKLQKHQTLPTPSAMEHKATAKNWKHQSGHMLSSIARRGELSPPNGKDMFLNPAFVEEMMGYPIGWLV